MHVPRCFVLALCLSASLTAPAQTAPTSQDSHQACCQTTAQTTAPTPPPVTTHPLYPSGTSTPLGATIATLLAAPGVSRAHWGIAITALDGTPLYGLNQGQLFRPASNAKLFTTSAAMALLGPESRFRTVISAMAQSELLPGAKPQPGVFDGNLTIMGGGDAYLSGRRVPYAAPGAAQSGPAAAPDPFQFFDDTASAIAASGIRVVRGSISGNEERWVGAPLNETWALEDTEWGYGAPVSAVSVNDNELELTLTPGKADNVNYHASAKLYPDTGFYAVTTNVDTVSGKPPDVQVEHPAGPRSLHIYGHIPPGQPYSTEVAIDDPPLFAAEVLKEALERHGIKVESKLETVRALPSLGDNLDPNFRLQGPLRPTQDADSVIDLILRDCQVIQSIMQDHPALGDACKNWVHVSPTLAEDVVVTLKVSQNLHAEMILRHLGERFGEDGSAADGAWVVRQWLIRAGLDPNDFVFYDGSGLSAKDLVTPRATAHLLAFATTQPWFAQWKAALPVGGIDGTLEYRFTQPPLQGHVFAKTGTLGESRALAGYVDAVSGRQVVFAIFSDNHSPGSSADRTVMDKIVAAIAAAE